MEYNQRKIKLHPPGFQVPINRNILFVSQYLISIKFARNYYYYFNQIKINISAYSLSIDQYPLYFQLKYDFVELLDHFYRTQ